MQGRWDWGSWHLRRRRARQPPIRLPRFKAFRPGINQPDWPSRGGPYLRGGPRFYGRPGPYWGHRAWVRRPYYGTIVAGVVLGTIVTVAAVGMIPRRPAPDLCWYWADPYQNRGYWDYCY